MAVSAEEKGGIPEIALAILCIVLAYLAGGVRSHGILWFICTLICWICYSLAFYIIGSLSTNLSGQSFRDDRSGSLAYSAVLFVGLTNSIISRSIPNGYQSLRASFQQLVQMVFVLVLIISPWSFGPPRLRFGLLLSELFLFWVAEERSRLLSVRARSRIKDDLLISEYMAKKHGNNQDLSLGQLSDCNYVVGGEVYRATYFDLLRLFLKRLANFGKELPKREVQSILDLLQALVHDVQHASTPGVTASTGIRYNKLVTVQDIWNHIPPSRGGQIHDYRDICLSFALFKLLRQRFRGCILHDSGHNKSKDFALKVLLADPPSDPTHPHSLRRVWHGLCPWYDPNRRSHFSSPRAFNIIEAELGFLFDFFYGNHLPDFCYLLSTLVFLVWMTSLSLFYKLRDQRKSNGIHEIANDWVIFFLFACLGLWRLLGALLSDWQKVNLLMYICRRRKRSSVNQEVTLFGVVSGSILRRMISFQSFFSRHPWARLHKARQYCLLLHGDSPSSSTRKIPYKAKEALVIALRKALLQRDRILSDGRFSLSRNELDAQLSWACRQEFVAEKVLVWHIATTLCHVGYTVQSTGNRAQPKECNDDHVVDDDHEVATLLSGYCAYIVGFAPELVADDIYATRLVFDNARVKASERVKGEGSLERMHESAKTMTFGSSGTDFDAATKLDVVIQGKMLASQLLHLEDDIRWRVLAEVWAELLLFISPTDNASAHLEKLKTRCELITLIWALLKHAGIPERPVNQTKHNNNSNNSPVDFEECV